MKIQIDNSIFNIIITKKRIKRIHIKIKEKDNLLISVPLFTKDKDVIKMIYDNKDWLIKKNNMLKKVNKECFYLFGEICEYNKENIKLGFSEIEKHFKRINDEFENKNTILSFRKMKSRWGTCFYKKNKITLNKSLIYVPLDLIDYVIYHEFVHFYHHNHSKEFYKCLEKYSYNHKYLKCELSKYNFCLSDEYNRKYSLD